MRTTYPLFVVIALGVMLLMFQGSGFNALIQGSQAPGPVGDEVESQGNSSVANDEQSLNASRQASDEGSIAGLILSSGRGVVDVFVLIALLPSTLQRLGFPLWFAAPVGSMVYIISGIGIVQFIRGSTLR